MYRLSLKSRQNCDDSHKMCYVELCMRVGGLRHAFPNIRKKHPEDYQAQEITFCRIWPLSGQNQSRRHPEWAG